MQTPKLVSKEEFYDFIDNYPRELKIYKNSCSCSFVDKKLGEYPFSIVAMFYIGLKSQEESSYQIERD